MAWRTLGSRETREEGAAGVLGKVRRGRAEARLMRREGRWMNVSPARKGNRVQ